MNPRMENFFQLPPQKRVLSLAGVIALVVGLFAYFLYLPKHEEFTRIKEENAQLQAKLQEDRRIAADLPKFKAEYEKMKSQLDQALTELPNQKEIPTLLTNVASLAKENGLDVVLFKPGGESPKGFYAEVPVELKLSGSYHQAGLFFASVANLSRIVNINNLSMNGGKSSGANVKPADGNGSGLSVECMATTFRFLEDGEKQTEGKEK